MPPVITISLGSRGRIVECCLCGFGKESWQRRNPSGLGSVSCLLAAGVKDASSYKWPLSTEIKNMSINRGRELK